MGYHRAGFAVVGVDIAPQPNYPFEFHQGDALEFIREYGRQFDVIHASPPCQSYLNLTRVNAALGRTAAHPDLIAPTRDALFIVAGANRRVIPWVIENVPNAPLRHPMRLCGTSFGLPLRRHRHFESNFDLTGPPCDHKRFTEKRYWTGWRPKGEHRLSTVVQVYGNAADKHEWPAAMGIDWATYDEIAEAIPPAYTEHVGGQLQRTLSIIRRRSA